MAERQVKDAEKARRGRRAQGAIPNRPSRDAPSRTSSRSPSCRAGSPVRAPAARRIDVDVVSYAPPRPAEPPLRAVTAAPTRRQPTAAAAGHDRSAAIPRSRRRRPGGRGEALPALAQLGQVVASEEAREHARLADEHPPVLHTHDRYGHRIDEVEFHPSWHWLMRTSVGWGLHGTPWAAERGHRRTRRPRRRLLPDGAARGRATAARSP